MDPSGTISDLCQEPIVTGRWASPHAMFLGSNDARPYTLTATRMGRIWEDRLEPKHIESCHAQGSAVERRDGPSRIFGKSFLYGAGTSEHWPGAKYALS